MGKILHITVVVATFVLFYDDKNTDCKYLEIEQSISQLIIIPVYTVSHYVTMLSLYYKMGGNNGVILHITVVVVIIPIFKYDKSTDFK